MNTVAVADLDPYDGKVARYSWLVIVIALGAGCTPLRITDVVVEMAIPSDRELAEAENRQQNEADERKRQQENADIQATSQRLERERELADATRPAYLDRTMIAEGLRPIVGRVSTCAARLPVSGRALVAVTVDRDGLVATVVVDEAPTTQIRTCVTSTLREAKFPRTRRGGSFHYTFWF